jgi:hypothetical protein
VTRQRIWVVGLSLVALLLFMPAATVGWRPHGTFGMEILRAENLVRKVAPDSPASRAGIVKGDRIDVGALGIDGHLDLMAPQPGTTLALTVIHNQSRFPATLTAVREEISPTLRWLIAGEFFSTAAFIVIGALLVFLRPAPMTWWLWLFCIGIVPVNQLVAFYAFLPHGAQTVEWLFARIFLGGFSAFPLMPFVLRFPHDRIGGWRTRIRWPSIALTAVLFVYYSAIAWTGLTRGIDDYSTLNAVPAVAIYFLAAGITVFTFVRSHGVDRQRLKWAVTGMLVGSFAQIFVYVPGPSWLSPLAGIVSIVMPVSIAYAALRHRLIDVEFVLNRALVYGGLTAILISIVSLVDFVVSQFIGEYHLALYAEAAASIAIGFALDRFRSQLDRITDTIFFKARHQAEANMQRIARSLQFVSQESSLYEALVDEPVRWLDLAAAALFTFDDARNVYARVHASGWADGTLDELPVDAPLVRYLRAERAHLLANDVGWNDAALPGGAGAPAVYVPILLRDDLRAFVAYGGHSDTTTLDPGEIALLAAFGPRASAAFDHLAFEDMQRRLQAALAGERVAATEQDAYHAGMQ